MADTLCKRKKKGKTGTVGRTRQIDKGHWQSDTKSSNPFRIPVHDTTQAFVQSGPLLTDFSLQPPNPKKLDESQDRMTRQDRVGRVGYDRVRPGTETAPLCSP